MKNLMDQIEVIDFYFSKIETYLGHKHKNLLLKTNMSGTDSIYSGSPKSSMSDRPSQTIEDEFERNDAGFEKISRRFQFPDEDDTIQKNLTNKASITGQTKKGPQRIIGIDDEFEKKAIFKDFTEPGLIKTGYLIPLACGHNGQMSINEKTIYEIHLTNAGFIPEHLSPLAEGADE